MFRSGIGRESPESLPAKYRVYYEELASSLSAFERVQEWPDLIKCLARVNKVLVKYASYEYVPCLVLLSKRLAQSLNPGLPSGVHLKALETYTVLLGRLGADNIVQNLGLFSTGLFPLLAYASVRVRPDLLKLFEDFFLPIGERLVPALSGLILALLPGIEDHTLETYDRVLKLLNNLRDTTNRSVFVFSLWRAMLQSPSCRLSALNYISATIPNHPGALLEFLPANRSIAIESIIATLHDENILTQRGMFEILIMHLPIYSDILTPEQTVSILHGSLPVLMKREVSINRRFFSWLLKSDSDETEEPLVISEKILQYLTLALKQMIQEISDILVKSLGNEVDMTVSIQSLPNSDSAVRPFELLNILMEKPQIQKSSLLEFLIHSLISFAYQWHLIGRSSAAKIEIASSGAKPKDMKIDPEEELALLVLKSAQIFFGNRISERLWGSITNMMEDEFLQSSKTKFLKLRNRCHDDLKVETLILVDFALNFLPFPRNTTELEISIISSFIEIILEGFLRPSWSNEAAKYAFQFILKLLQKSKISISLSKEVMLRFFESFAFVPGNDILCGSKSVLGFPLDSKDEADPVLTSRLSLLVLETLGLQLNLFQLLLSSQIKLAEDQEDLSYLSALKRALVRFAEHVYALAISTDPDLSCMGSHMWIDLMSLDHLRENADNHQLCLKLVVRLWNLLSPNYTDYHHQVCKHLYSLVKIDKQACHHVIAESMLHNELEAIESYRRFSILWSTIGEIAPETTSFQEILLLMLDALEDKRPSIRLIARSWLQDTLGSIERIVDPLFSVLFDLSTNRLGPNFEYAGVYDARLVLYAFQKLQSIIMSDASAVLENISEKAIQKSVREKFDSVEAFFLKNAKESVKKTSESFLDPQDYLDLLVVASLRFIQGTPSSFRHKVFLEQAAKVRSFSVEFLRNLISIIPSALRSQQIVLGLLEPIIECLSISFIQNDSMMQIQLLGLLRVIMNEMNSKELPQKCYVILTGASFSSTLLNGIQKAHDDFHANNLGNSVNIAQESLSLLSHWVWFIVSSLPFMRKAIGPIAFACTNVLCQCIQAPVSSKLYNSAHPLLLYGLRGIFQHCLFPSNSNGEVKSNAKDTVSAESSFAPVQMLTGLFVGVFGSRSQPNSQPLLEEKEPQKEAQETLLQLLPVVVEAIVFAWHSSTKALEALSSYKQSKFPEKSRRQLIRRKFAEDEQVLELLPAHGLKSYIVSSNFTFSNHEKKVKNEILQILSPMVAKYPKVLLRALLHTWEKAISAEAQIILESNQNENFHYTVILEILNSLANATPSLILSSLVPVAISTIEAADNQGGKSPTNVSQTAENISPLRIHETSALHFLDSYVRKCSRPDQLIDAWSSIFELIKMCLQLSTHPFTFLWLIGIIQKFVRKCSPSKMDKKIQKDLQDTVQQLLQTCAMFAGQSIRYNLQKGHVIPIPDIHRYVAPLKEYGEDDDIDMPPLAPWLTDKSSSNLQKVSFLSPDQSVNVITLRSLANVVAIFVDDVWDDKEKANLVLLQIIPHILPIFDVHAVENIDFSVAASVLMSSFTVGKFKYTVKAWSKSAWTLFLKPKFFFTDLQSLQHWRYIISRTVAQDKSLFLDLIAKSSSSQSRIFQSQKAAILERSKMMKSLTYIIHSGRRDQFGRFLPQIIELVVDALKTLSAPSLHAQVIFLIRTLLARSSPENLTPLWPVVLTEVIRACEESENLEVLYQACKFIDLALIIAPRQFQLYQWMFFVDKPACLEINEKKTVLNDTNESKNFVPHLLFLSKRIARMSPEAGDVVSKSVSGFASLNIPKAELQQSSMGLRRPLLTTRKITSVGQLVGFHDVLSDWIAFNSFNPNPPDYEFIDDLLLCDFIEYGDEYEDPLSQNQSFIANDQITQNENTDPQQILDQTQDDEINQEIARFKEQGLL